MWAWTLPDTNVLSAYMARYSYRKTFQVTVGWLIDIHALD